MLDRINWTKSSYCADSACIEVAKLSDGNIGLRDNKRPEQPHLTFTPEAWDTFRNAVMAGEVLGR